jgi:tetratricopeptide (TPR) repeat protein
MAKNRKLDTCYKALSLIALLVMLASCSLPRLWILNDPLTPEEHINLGVTYEKQGEFEGALREYGAASKELPIAYLYIGNVYFSMKDVNRAEASYKKAIKKTGEPKAYNNLAWLYYSTDVKLEEAERLATRAVELAPDAADFRDTLQKIVGKRLEKGR